MQPIIQSKNADGSLNVLMPASGNFLDATGQPIRGYLLKRMTPAQLDAQIAQSTATTTGYQAIKDAASKLPAITPAQALI